MSDFTRLLNQGIRRYVDKYVRKREFGRCEGCGARALLVRAAWRDAGASFIGEPSMEVSLCTGCYDNLLREMDNEQGGT